MKPEGRNINHLQYLKLGTLLTNLDYVLSVVLAVLLAVPAFMALLSLIVSCDPEPVQTVSQDNEVIIVGDSTSVNDKKDILTKMELSVGGKTGEGKKLGEIIDAVDVFVYGVDGTKELESHERISVGELDEIGGKEYLSVKSGSEGPRTVVIVANCPRSFNIKALSKMDSMELLEYEFLDEDPARPLMSGEIVMTPGKDGVIEITPLLCKVILKSVSNGLDDYELLEEPSVRLCDINPSARILQQKDFSPNAFIGQGVLHTLPTDIGFYTRYPDISLYCYPNDTPETTLGMPHTSMEFNCRILGEECVFPISLPPLGRGSSTSVDIIVNGPNDWNYKVNKN